MRGLVIALCLLACGDDDSGGGTAQPDALVDGVSVDAPAFVCGPMGLCESGPMCGAICCKSGERCVEGTCMCGDEAACADGDYCMAGGPVAPSHGCGLFCCGPVSGVGCPI